MILYIAATADKYELPIMIEHNIYEMSLKIGYPVNTIRNNIKNKANGSRLGIRFFKVEVEND